MPASTIAAVSPPVLTIELLGAFGVRVGARVVPPSAWRLRKAAHLVKLLALAPGHRLHREQLCDLLWPDVAPASAYNNLRYALHSARAVLAASGGGATRLPMQQQILMLAAPFVIDVETFEAAAAHCPDNPDAYHVAIALYTGDLLPDDRYEDWTTTRRAVLRATAQGLCLACARLHEARGAIDDALPLLRRIVAADPTAEEAQVLLMRLYAGQGQRAVALTQFARLRTALREELGVEPTATSQQLHAQIIAGTFPVVVPPTAPAPRIAFPRNLPEPLTRFIGRVRECAAVRDVLGTRRMVTLLGAGGCGKTRLALAVAADLAPMYLDGVWLIDCAPLTAGAQVAPTVAVTLGIREGGARPPLAVLTEALRPRRLLLVLDNCEHVLAACADLATTVLTACPQVRILATSRAALGVPGEATWRVPSLTLPVADASPEQLAVSEAVQLFVDRARWRQPDFTLTADNAVAIAAICHRLDGMPLALELAAARLNVLTVAQLVTRLDDALHLLVDGRRTALPRQQTLRATLDWSYAFLDAPARRLLGRLASFAGGCDLAAVEAICADSEIPTPDILALLAHLIDHSWLVVEMQPGGARYRLLEVVRQYAREHLLAHDNANAVAQRHAAYYLALAEEANQALSGPDQANWLARLEAEHDNLRAALHRALEQGACEMGLHLVRDLWRFWYARGYLSEGETWFTHFLALGRSMLATLPAPLWREVLFGAGRVAYFRGDYRTAAAHFAEMRANAQAVGDLAHLASALTQLGNVALYTGAVADAQALYAEGLALRRTLGEVRMVGSSLGNLGWAALAVSDFTMALAYFTESLPLHQHLGDTIEVMRTLTGLGLVATGLRDDATAHAHFTECLALAQRLDAKRAIADCLEGLAALAAAQGRFARALRLAGAAETLAVAIGNPLPPYWQERRAQVLAPARRALGDAASAEMLLNGRITPLAQTIAAALDPAADE